MKIIENLIESSLLTNDEMDTINGGNLADLNLFANCICYGNNNGLLNCDYHNINVLAHCRCSGDSTPNVNAYGVCSCGGGVPIKA